MSFSERLHKVIPGGAHTYSRGDDQFPSNAPAILSHGKGSHVWDIDGNEFLDYGMGLRSVNIGYGNEEIAKAVYEEALKGNNLTRASYTELSAAELLSELIPSAEMVKFAKHGSTVTTAAVKLARAYNGRKYIAIPKEQPFFSFDDWFIGSTVMNRGVPEESSRFTIRFNYNDLKSLEGLFDQYEGQIACVIMEGSTTIGPCLSDCEEKFKNNCSTCPNCKMNFLHKVKDLCRRNGSLFILDEMITGFRMNLLGAQHFFNVEPDISTFGKAMANGFAVSALTGKREVMNLGGILDEGKERVFLTSTTHGSEMSALGAFIKTVEILKRENVVSFFWKYGKELMDGINDLSKSLGIMEFFYLEGYPCSPNYVTKDSFGNNSLLFRTLFSQEMVNNGVLMPYIALSYSHSRSDFEKTLNAAENALKIYSRALQGDVNSFLKSKVIKPVFRKYN